VDEWNGTVTQLRSFKNQTGVTFPLLLNGGSATGGNFATLYGPYDNYVVVSKQGIVRYHAALTWPHENRYHLNEIRGAVDTLVTGVTSVEPTAAPGLRLSSLPNPARGVTTVELGIPAGGSRSARVTVHDIAGRQVATLWEGPLGPGLARLPWSHVDTRGGALPPGIYLIRAEIDGRWLTHRAVILP
jgi:hypothetical protein